MSTKVNLSVKLLLVFVACLTLAASPAGASITEEEVQRGWEQIAKADGFDPLPIHYENDASPNAWVRFESSNSFTIHVTRGLMRILNHEDEIAGVLGHELGHIRCGHYNQGVNRRIGWAVLGSVLRNQGGLVRAIGGVGANLVESGFSREQEVEADDYGTDLLAKTGYDPWGLYRAMKAFKDNGFTTAPSGFNSHPPTDRRLEHLSNRVKEIEKREGTVSKEPEKEPVKAGADGKAKSKSRDWDSEWEKLKQDLNATPKN